jgi:hypothetical protein
MICENEIRLKLIWTELNAKMRRMQIETCLGANPAASSELVDTTNECASVIQSNMTDDTPKGSEHESIMSHEFSKGKEILKNFDLPHEDPFLSPEVTGQPTTEVKRLSINVQGKLPGSWTLIRAKQLVHEFDGYSATTFSSLPPLINHDSLPIFLEIGANFLASTWTSNFSLLQSFLQWQPNLSGPGKNNSLKGVSSEGYLLVTAPCDSITAPNDFAMTSSIAARKDFSMVAVASILNYFSLSRKNCLSCSDGFELFKTIDSLCSSFEKYHGFFSALLEELAKSLADSKDELLANTLTSLFQGKAISRLSLDVGFLFLSAVSLYLHPFISKTRFLIMPKQISDNSYARQIKPNSLERVEVVAKFGKYIEVETIWPPLV